MSLKSDLFAGTFRRAATAAGVAAVLSLLATSVSAQNTETAYDGISLDYVVVDQRVTDLFSMIERDTGIRILWTDAVRGRVQRRSVTGPVVTALKRLAASQDLDLFVFSGTIYVSAKSEATLRMVRLNGIEKDRAISALSKAGLEFAQDDLRETADGSALTFTGPPRMLALAEAIVENIPPATSPVHPAASTVRVRRGVQVQYETIMEKRATPSSQTEAETRPEQGADNG